MTLGLLSICVSPYFSGFPFPHRVPAQAQASPVLPSFSTGLTSISHRRTRCHQVLCKQNMRQENALTRSVGGPARHICHPSNEDARVPPRAVTSRLPTGRSGHHCPGAIGAARPHNFTRFYRIVPPRKGSPRL